jgi:hypothetical protein
MEEKSSSVGEVESFCGSFAILWQKLESFPSLRAYFCASDTYLKQ